MVWKIPKSNYEHELLGLFRCCGFQSKRWGKRSSIFNLYSGCRFRPTFGSRTKNTTCVYTQCKTLPQQDVYPTKYFLCLHIVLPELHVILHLFRPSLIVLYLLYKFPNCCLHTWRFAVSWKVGMYAGPQKRTLLWLNLVIV